MSEVKVNKLSPRSGTTVTLGDSGDTFTIPSGVTLSNAGTINTGGLTTTGNINFGDNDKAQFGASNDLQIYHDGSFSRIKDLGTGALVLDTDGTDVRITKTDTEFMAKFVIDGAVELYYDNTKRFETTSSGALVTGRLSTSAGNASEPNFNFSADGNTGIYRASEDVIAFSNNGSESMRIDSSGILLINKTSAGLSTPGIEFDGSNNRAQFTRSGTPINVNRLSSDGGLINFYKDSTFFGAIKNDNSNNLIIGNATRGLKFSNTLFIPRDMDDTSSDNQVSIGSSASRFADIYLGGGLYVGGTGSANKLDDYEEGTHTADLNPSTSGSIALGGNENRLAYVKIGNWVHIQGQVNINIPSSPVGFLKLTLPFTSASLDENADHVSASVFVNNPLSANMNEFVAKIAPSTSELRIYLGDATSAQEDSAQEMRSGTSIAISVSYRTT